MYIDMDDLVYDKIMDGESLVSEIRGDRDPSLMTMGNHIGRRPLMYPRDTGSGNMNIVGRFNIILLCLIR